jgi:NAD(P)-dependent dehydrogenase (short-subunit alcohol dehydrogenase family)
MSESLRTELSPFGVRVALVEPGLFNTSFQDNAVVSEKADSEELAYAPYIQRYRKNHDRFQRFGDDPIKVAKVIHKIIASPNPAFRNPVGIEARAGIFGARVLPEKIYWSLLTRATLK